MKTPFLAVLLALPFLFGPFASADNNWTEVRSPHFTVITDAGDKKGRDVAQRLEQMRSAFGVLVGLKQVNIPVPVTVIAFKSTKEIRAFAPLFNGKPVELAGYFQPGQDRDYIALDLSAENALEATFHEYAHMLLNGNYPAMPLWFDEGFAQYYETINIDKRKVDVGKPPANIGYVFQQFDLVPVEQILQVQHASKEYNESGGRRTIFYAQSWLMVHYLFEKKMLPQLSEYAYLTMGKHVPPLQAFPRAFGMRPADFQALLRPYMRSMMFTTYTLTGELPQESFAARPLSPVDAQVALAELHLHEMDHQAKGVEELEAALLADPANTSAHRGLGYAYLRRGDYDRAAAHFHEAVKGGSQDGRVYYYSAMLTQIRGRTDDDQMKTMRDQAARAVELEPDFADAYSLLAYAESSLGNVDAGEAAMAKAVQLSPRNEQYALRLGQFLMAQKKWDEATALLTRAEDSNEYAVAQAARDALQMIERAKGMKDVRVSLHGNYIEMHGDEPPRVLTTRADQPARPSSADEAPPEPAPAPPPHVTAIDFLKGTLVAVDCSSAPGATVTVASRGKTWTFQIADRAQVLLMGAETFSCAWKNRKVAVNYRATGATSGSLVSLELQ